LPVITISLSDSRGANTAPNLDIKRLSRHYDQLTVREVEAANRGRYTLGRRKGPLLEPARRPSRRWRPSLPSAAFPNIWFWKSEPCATMLFRNTHPIERARAQDHADGNNTFDLFVSRRPNRQKEKIPIGVAMSP
jgi:hypothetical protein